MILDDNLIFFEAASLGSAVTSAAVPLNSLKKPGREEPICVFAMCNQTAATGTSITLKLQEADSESGEYSDVPGSSETILTAALVKGARIYLRWLPGNVKKNWLKVDVTLTGSDFTAGKITAAIVREDSLPYEAGLYIDKGRVVG
ncbi:MAG: hypothetical protein E7022_05885 [Desulfovibrio desulfuricans]|nr:hypothetical protein [Desulfovibrio desulfuricans]